MTDSTPIEKKLSTYQVALIENLSILKRAAPLTVARFGGEYGPVYVRWPDIDGEEISAVISELGELEVRPGVDSDTPAATLPDLNPTDWGGIQRFQLAERLFESGMGPVLHPSLFDENPSIQRYWLDIAEEAIAALIEEPRNE